HHYRPQNPLAVYYTPSDKDQIHDHHPYGINNAIFDIDGTPLSESFIIEGKQITKVLCENVKQGLPEKDDVSIYDGIREKH
ncbi:unnamed protein product, partial [Rotaria magnacalcarata]